MKLLTTAGLVAALAMGALAGTATTAGAQPGVETTRAGQTGPEAYDPPPVRWGRCADRDLRDSDLQCGSLPVPLDYSEPDGETITLDLSRLRPARNAGLSNGVMLLNPGGPGQSGLFTPFEGVFFGRKIERSYDWVSWDPRGVGASTPRLECRDGDFGYDRPDFVPESPEELTTLRVRAFSFAAHCQLGGGSRLLDHIKTSDNVSDMKVIRRALESEKLDFYGFSYGSQLGQVYATRYPQRVGRMVLDGVADPRRQPYQGYGQDQNTAFNANINRFFAWVAENDAAYGLGTSTRAVRRTWYRLRDQAREEAFAGKIGSSEWTDLFLRATYSVDSWRGLARRLQQTANGEYEALVRRYDTGIRAIRSTSPPSAPTPRGPRRGSSWPMPVGRTGARRSRPGRTPGTTLRV